MTRRGVGRVRRFAVGLVLASALALTGCGISIPPLGQNGQPDPSKDPQPTSEQGSTVPTENSTLDAAGLARIIDSGEARFDLSDGPIAKSALALDDSAYAPDVQSPGKPITLEITGPDGTLTATTDRVRFLTTDSSAVVTKITYFLLAETTEELFGQLRDASTEYGIDSGDIEAWIASRQGGTDSDGVSDFAFDPGTTLGMNVSYDVRYDESKSPQVVIVEVYPLD